jgi:DNA-binding NarL/FixJ family response regulator
MAQRYAGAKNMAGPYNILLADDYILFRHELRKLIERVAGLEIVAEVGDGAALFQFLEKASPDLVILDIHMPHLRAMEATQLLKLKHPGVKVLIMVMDHEEEYLTQARSAGADGLLSKQYAAAELLEAIEAIRAGKFYLPAQFREEKSCIATVGERRNWTLLDQATSR